MSNEFVLAETQGDLNVLLKNIKTLNDKEEVKSILLMVADESSHLKEDLSSHLKSFDKNLFGGFFPRLVMNDQTLETGTLVIGLPFETTTHRVDDLSKSVGDLDSKLQKIEKSLSKTKSIFVYVDGLSSEIGPFIEAVYSNLGSDYNYMGGGAGSLSFKPSPCIITNEGIFQDCALLVETTQEVGVGVSHGWEKVAGPFRVTESEKNKIISLDWEPAFDVYKKIVEKKSGQKISSENFFEVAKAFPFGINRLDSEVVVRDPILLEDQSLVCVGDVPENEYVNILMGSELSLINAASTATQNAMSLVTGNKSNPVLVMDCISRALFLGDNFKNELQAIKADQSVLAGALCLGEIANNGNSYLEFFNKTCVVGKIGKAA